jgi:hypothetical protein
LGLGGDLLFTESLLRALCSLGDHTANWNYDWFGNLQDLLGHVYHLEPSEFALVDPDVSRFS